MPPPASSSESGGDRPLALPSLATDRERELSGINDQLRVRATRAAARVAEPRRYECSFEATETEKRLRLEISLLNSALTEANKKVTSMEVERRRQRDADVGALEVELERLRRESHSLRSERDQLSARFDTLISELAGRRLDRTRTYASNDRTPEEVRSALRQFLDQELREVGQMVWAHRCRLRAVPRDCRRAEMVLIDSALTGISLVQESSRELLWRAEGYLRESLAILREIHGSDPSKLEMIRRVETALTGLGDGSGETAAQRDQRRDSTLKRLGKLLGMELKTDPSLVERLSRFIEKGWTIAQTIGRTNPPGALFAVEAGTPFDATIHRAGPGSAEEGSVRFTLQPGYRQGNRVYESPLVFVGEPCAPNSGL
jgi:hypothetical protein